MKVLIVKNVILPYLAALILLGMVYSLINNDDPIWRLIYILLALVAMGLHPMELKYRKMADVKTRFWSLETARIVIVGISVFALLIVFGQYIVHSFVAQFVCYGLLVLIVMLCELLKTVKCRQPMRTWSLIFMDTCWFFYAISILPRVIDTLSR